MRAAPAPPTLDGVSVVFRAVDVPAAAREDYWRQVHHDQFGGLDVANDRRLGTADQLIVGELGPLRVAVLSSGPGCARRTPRQVQRVDPDRYLLIVQDDGRARIGHGGALAELQPGDFGLVDLSRPFRCLHSADRTVMLTFPTSALPLRRSDIGGLAGARIPGDSGVPALVSTLVRTLPAHLDDPGVARLGTAVLDLLTVALAARVDRPSAAGPEARRHALRERVRAFVEAQLSVPDLSPSTVAAAHHISVRYLHRLFEDEEHGVAGWIRRRRLERCRTDLLDRTLADRSVAATAARWGFTNAAHFNRLFRETYGLPPGAYRQAYAAYLDLSPAAVPSWSPARAAGRGARSGR